MAEFREIAKLADLPNGRILEFEVAGRPICAVKMGDAVHAFARYCTHEFVEMSYGYVMNGLVYCAQHGAAFNLEDGEPESGPTDMPIKVYPTRIEGDSVLVSDEPSN